MFGDFTFLLDSERTLPESYGPTAAKGALVIGLFVVFALLIYLFYSLLYPENFS